MDTYNTFMIGRIIAIIMDLVYHKLNCMGINSTNYPIPPMAISTPATIRKTQAHQDLEAPGTNATSMQVSHELFNSRAPTTYQWNEFLTRLIHQLNEIL